MVDRAGIRVEQSVQAILGKAFRGELMQGSLTN
jgi:hypothetical protein